MSLTRKKTYSYRLMALLLTLVLLTVPSLFAYAEERTSGTCGTNLSWTLDAGTLTISGSGPMENYPESKMAPWYDYRDQITRVILPDGLTTIGDLAFYQCTNLSTIKIPDSVITIGKFAFMECINLKFISMSLGVKEIQRSAFERCESLTSIRLPESLITIAYRAFYRCKSLTTITVPSTVTDLDTSVFAYCEMLARAEILAPLKSLPEWTFFGCTNLTSVALAETMEGVDTYAFHHCDNLSTVDYQGSRQNSVAIEKDIAKDCPQFPAMGSITSTGGLGSANSTITTETEDAVIVQNTTATQGENMIVGTVQTDIYKNDQLDKSTTEMTATLENQNGWKDLSDEVQIKLEDQLNKNEKEMEPVKVTVYLKRETELRQEVLERFAGKEVELTVQTEDGSSWTVDCSELRAGKVNENCDLSYVVMGADPEISEKMSGAKAYSLRFHHDAEINAKVSIQLPIEHARHNAFLYQKNGKKLERLQAVVIDTNGYAQFYLASVSAEMEYFIGIDVPGEATDTVIVPENLAGEFDANMNYQPIQYVITGRKSSWGMNINQVTWILAGVMAVTIVTVGVTVGALNKRKLKRGYVPDIGDE